MTTALLPRLRRVAGGVLWYLRQASGEARWDAYLDQCRRDGTTPMSRRAFERHRAEHREHHPQSRCC